LKHTHRTSASAPPPDRPPTHAARRQAIREAFAELTVRSQRDGVLRGDITWRDLVIVARAAVATTPALGIRADEGQWQRTLAVLLDGPRPPGTEPLPGEPPSDTDLQKTGHEC
jgi:hypothetical protein